MRWIRSWPLEVPPGRAHIVDDMPRCTIRDYDYSGLTGLDDDVILIEWDMAISCEDRHKFEHYAYLARDIPTVAPYPLYAPAPVHWAHRVLEPAGERWVRLQEQECDYFGFGLVYLPYKLLRAFCDAPAPERGRPPDVYPGHYGDCRLTDQTFSVWYRHRYGGPRPLIQWDVRPVHLHYERHTA